MDAAIDQNSKQTITARLKTSNTTITRLTANPSTGALSTSITTLDAVAPSTFAATDGNNRTSWFAVSENNSTQLIALQCDSSGNLLIKIV